MTSDEVIVAELELSDDYLEFSEAFQAATGLPLTLTPASHLTLALCSKHQSRTSFCSLMTQAGSRCDTCRALHREIEKEMGLNEVNATEEEVYARNTECPVWAMPFENVGNGEVGYNSSKVDGKVEDVENSGD